MTQEPTPWAFRLSLFAVASLSIGSLLVYFFGLASFFTAGVTLLAVELAGLIALAGYAWKHGWTGALQIIAGGLWAGFVATLVYDIVRVPIARSGVPIFKAISYFGTVLLGVDRPTPLSELAGWAYHCSNGVSFGLMYTAIVPRPGILSAVIWGLSLEGAMLLTPYAEVFGYRRDARFMSITIGSHVVFGAALWWSLRCWSSPRLSRRTIVASAAASAVILAIVAADFHRLQAARLPVSPPASMGRELLVTWDVPEPDRVAAMWLVKRFDQPNARFYFVPPFHPLSFGTPFDVPEAAIRRAGSLAATEVLLGTFQRPADDRLRLLGRTAHLTEITPWMMPSDPAAAELASYLRDVAQTHCGDRLRPGCVDRLFEALDHWYATGRPR